MGWKYSDDTVMHMATADAMIACKKDTPLNTVCVEMGKKYK